MVELEKGYLVPKWVIKGLEVTNKLVDKMIDNAVDKFNKDKQGADITFIFMYTYA